eukprot:1683115-Rhodomonas_salina.1
MQRAVARQRAAGRCEAGDTRSGRESSRSSIVWRVTCYALATPCPVLTYFAVLVYLPTPTLRHARH